MPSPNDGSSPSNVSAVAPASATLKKTPTKVSEYSVGDLRSVGRVHERALGDPEPGRECEADGRDDREPEKGRALPDDADAGAHEPHTVADAHRHAA